MNYLDSDYKVQELINMVNITSENFYNQYYNLIKTASNFNYKDGMEILMKTLNSLIALRYFPIFANIENRKEKSDPHLLFFHVESIVNIMIYSVNYFDPKKSMPKIKMLDFFNSLLGYPSPPIIEQVKFNEIFLNYENADEILTHEVNQGLFERILTIDTSFPDLYFDPEFNKVKNTDWIKYLYSNTRRDYYDEYTDESIVNDYITQKNKINSQTKNLKKNRVRNFNKLQELNEFAQNTFANSWKLSKSEKNKIYNDINKRLISIGKDIGMRLPSWDTLLEPNKFAVMFFSSIKIFDDIMNFLKPYFISKVPSKKQEINIFFEGFKVIFEECLGKGFEIFEFPALKDKLSAKMKKEDMEKFLNRFIYDKQYNKFTLNPVFKDLHNYSSVFSGTVEKWGFYHSGKVYSGIFLIWRSFIRYIKSLMQTKEFRKFKGIAMEKACAQILEEYGTQYEKIILKNRNMEGTNRYERMKEQISFFPKEPLEFEIDFPNDYLSTFEEIDLAFKVGSSLMLLEVKGSLISQEFYYDSLQYLRNNVEELNRLEKKCRILQNALNEKMINHQFFEGVDIDDIAILMIRNEGIYGKEAICNYNDFKSWLEKIIKQEKAGTLETIHYQRWYKLS